MYIRLAANHYQVITSVPGYLHICITLHDRLDAIHRSGTPNPLCSLVESVWDVKEWLEPYLET